MCVFSGSNVCQLLPLTEEYQMVKLTERCERYLLSQPPSVKSLMLAETYNLVKLMRICVQYAKTTPLSQLQIQPEFDQVNPATMVEILVYKVEKLETPMNLIRAVTVYTKPNTSKWCTSADSRDVNNRHDLGAKKGCIHCNSYNFEQIDKICTRLKINL